MVTKIHPVESNLSSILQCLEKLSDALQCHEDSTRDENGPK